MADSTDTATLLRNAADALAALAPGDKNTIARVGAALESAAQALPPDCPEGGALLAAVLDALQALYMETLPRHDAAPAALAEALRALDGTRDPARIERAREQLRALRLAPEPAPAPAPPADAPRVDCRQAVNEITAILICAGPEDEDVLRQAEARSAALDLTEMAPGPRAKVAEARQRLAALLSDAAGRSPEAISQVQELLAQAAREDECPPVAAATRPAPETPPPPANTPVATPAQAPAAPADAGGLLPADTDMELLKEFVTECLEHIRNAESGLLTIETDPANNEALHTVFRAFHTIKGTSGFIGLDRIQKLAHLAEGLLDDAREGRISLTGGYADLTLESCDMLKSMIGDLKSAAPGEPLAQPAEYDSLIARLVTPDPTSASIPTLAAQPVTPRLGDVLVSGNLATREAVEKAAQDTHAAHIGEALVAAGVAPVSTVAAALRAQKQADKATSESTARVSTDRLDALINMVGELVISHSMIAQDPDVLGGRLPQMTRNVGQTGKIVRELQDLTMALRMVPLKATFQKMARLARDLSRKSGKSIQFLSEGEDTEIDRNMVEALNDPLVHMVRNAADHGIESADARAAADKPPTGTIRLRAFHSAGNVVINLSDDGQGLNCERIRAKAVERKLIDPDRVLSESETFALIFLPGFSTAEKVTDVSGRGVGMDVVKRNIDALHGRIEIASTPGRGASFTLRLPLTMAITDAMVMRVGRVRYLLPTVAIEQSFHPARGSVSTVANRGEMVMLRGELIPVVRLHRLYNVPDAVQDPYQALLVSVETEDRRCAVMVDELLGQQQVVVKSLGHGLRHVPGVSGGAILGNGRVGLILDADGIYKLSQTCGLRARAEPAVMSAN
jgi:two-component system chemotaxis sensor kinase CheA